MPYVMDNGYSPVGDFGVITPCPPPEGCPPGTVAKPCGRPDAAGKVGPAGCYPNHSSSCCKAIPGYVAPPPGSEELVGRTDLPGRTSVAPPLPDFLTSGGASVGAWFSMYKWYVIGSAVLLTAGAVAYTMLRKRAPSPATSYIPGYDDED